MSEAAGDSTLMLERDEQLQMADSALRAAEQGAGSVIVLEGPAGIGKTSLLSAIARRAQRRGLTRLWATAGERERDLEWSVVRSLFAPALKALDDAARSGLERGPARLGLPLIDGFVSGDLPADQDALLYALYWFALEFAREAPLLLAVDDAHWADEASLRWLAYVGARVPDAQIVLALSRRSDAAPMELQALAAHEWSRILEPAPLSAAACARVLAESLECEPDSRFTDVCVKLTAGNPFLLAALVNWLQERDVSPVRSAVSQLTEARPGEVQRWVMLRLGELPPPALEMARATAILGAHATLGRVSNLLGVELGAVAHVATRLQRAGILQDHAATQPTLEPSGPGRLQFAHPLLASVVYDSVSSFERIALHTEAARLLQRERAPAPAIAHQLMFTEPTGDPAIAEVLRAGAGEAMASGSPQVAAARLSRALAEPPPDSERAAVLHELGRAETAASLPDSLEHLERAYDHADSPGQRGSIAEDLALALMGHMRLEDSARVLRAAITDVYTSAERASSDEAQRLGALYVTFCCYLRRGSKARAWLESLGAAPDAATPGGRLLLVAYSHQAITSGESVVSASKLAQDALVGGLLKDVGPASSQIWTAVSTLIIGGSYAAAEVAIADAVAAAQQAGSSYGYAMALCFDGLLAYRRGRLEHAIANERRATEMLAGEHAAGPRHYAVAFLAHALIDVGELQLAAEQLDALPLDDAPPLAPYAFGVAARGR